jgi:hypothetical protein
MFAPEHFPAKWNPVCRKKMLLTNSSRVFYSQTRIHPRITSEGMLLRNTRMNRQYKPDPPGQAIPVSHFSAAEDGLS